MSESDEPPASVLYFPNFAPDDSWLKCALLYWDRVWRIVPDEAVKEVENRDSPVARAAVRKELLVSVDPEGYRDKAGERFHSQVTSMISDRASQSGLEWCQTQLRKRTRLHKSKIGNIQLSWLRREKLPYAIRSELQARKLLASDSGPFVRVPKLVGDLYMTCLAAEIGETDGVPVFTDDNGLALGSRQIVGTAPTFQRPGRSRHDDLQLVGIEFPSAASIAKVPMSKIISFRSDHAAERRNFRDRIESFVGQLAAASTPAKYREVIAQTSEQVADGVRARRGLFRELGVIAFNSFLTLSVPAALKSLPTSITEYVNVPALSVAGLCIGAAAGWAKLRQDRQKAVDANPWHYALTVKKKFG